MTTWLQPLRMLAPFVFVEDRSQQDKLRGNLSLGYYFVILYKGRSVRSVQFWHDDKRISFHFSRFILALLFSRVVICEFPNGLPRLFSLIFMKRIDAHLFGVLSLDDFRFPKFSWTPRFIKLFWCTLFADSYYIYGNLNPSRQLSAKLRIGFRSNVYFCDRKDLQHMTFPEAREDWRLFIGQPWSIIPVDELDLLQKNIVQLLCARFSNVYYCVHPREQYLPVEECAKVFGLPQLLQRMQECGLPSFAVTINSSLGYELAELGVKVFFLSEFEEGRFVFYDLNKSLAVLGNV